MQRKRLIAYLLNLFSVADSAHFWRSVCLAIILTYINSVRKSLVASCVCVCVCVCVAEARARVFNTFVSSAEVFISSVKRVRLQRQKHSSPAQNVFVACDKHVRLQCDLYLEVSSRHYLIANDQCVSLECEIIFGGD